MQRIMLDMDDVIVTGGMLNLINEYLSTNYTEDDFKEYYMQDIIPEDKRKEFMKFFFSKNWYDYSIINPNAYEVMEKLSQKYKLYIGTSYIFKDHIRESEIILLYKYNFLLDKFPFLTPNNIVFLMDKSVLNCEIKIDDRIDNLEGAGRKILYTAYHNKDISDEELSRLGIERADNFLDIEKLLLNE